MREMVYQRDRGICALCGVNASKEYGLWKAARMEARRMFRWFWNRYLGDTAQERGIWYQAASMKEEEAWINRWVPNPGWTIRRSTGWDADHIVPVVMGGGNGGLANMRTACHPCHKRVTRELAAQRAERRRLDWPFQRLPQGVTKANCSDRDPIVNGLGFLKGPMAYIHTNKKGVEYTLCSRTSELKSGSKGTIFFFKKDMTGDTINVPCDIPEGKEVVEQPSGLLTLKNIVK